MTEFLYLGDVVKYVKYVNGKVFLSQLVFLDGVSGTRLKERSLVILCVVNYSCYIQVMHTNYEWHITLNLEKDGLEEVENCLREMQYACFFFGHISAFHLSCD